MFEKITPEQAGISSKAVSRFIRKLNERGLATHSVVLMRGDSIFGEFYWKPFHRDFNHRMYSVTKSFVGIAIGLLRDDGKLSLDDTIASFFPDKIDGALPDNLARQTIRDMLTMSTCGHTPYWFTDEDPDRTHLYLNRNTAHRPAGMCFEYDSPGSQVLCTLVERLTGKAFFDFLNERLFSYLGTFKTASILKTRTEDSFGDSAMICTTRDAASFGRLLMNGGAWNGRQLISADYVREATAMQVDCDELGFDAFSTHGYGYQIWRLRDGFFFNGMGSQFTFCLPKRDLIFSINSDNQGYPAAGALIEAAFYDFIVDELHDEPLPEDPTAYADCEALAQSLELMHLVGPDHSVYERELHGKVYHCAENPTGITQFAFSFNGDEGVLHYVNAQGQKELHFGLGKNTFGKFPQLGYSDEHAGAVTTNGFMYDCACSAAWREERKLLIKVQIIDRYFGNMLAMFSFKGDVAVVRMVKTAENFLNEYSGEFCAVRA